MINTMRKSLLFLFAVLVFCACQRPSVQVVSVTTAALPVDASLDAIQDTDYLAQLAPAKEALEREMNVQIGFAPERLWVREPECPMLNWASDALWEAAKKVFELMPFDNMLVILTLKGSDIIALCESFARYGGQGVAGMRVKTVDGKLADVQIAGKPVNPLADYTVATSDYLSGGTDHMEALTRYVAYWNSELKIRDLYLEAVREQDTIRAAVDGRMTMLP